MTPPVISAVGTSAVTATGATVTWTTDEPATTRVDYGTTTAYGQSSTADLSLTTSHSRQLLGLNPSTTYHYRVISADAATNTSTSPDAQFTTPAMPPPRSAVDKQIVVQGHGTATTPQFSTAEPGELLVAFVASDGSGFLAQNVSVSGGGLTWTRARQTHGQPGDTEVWTALAPTVVSNITVTSTQSSCCFDNLLTVIAFQGAAGIGATVIGSGSGGVPQATVVPAKTGSWVYGVAMDWDLASARTPGLFQVLPAQSGRHLGRRYLLGATLQPEDHRGHGAGPPDPSPVPGRWNYTAVEITPAP